MKIEHIIETHKMPIERETVVNLLFTSNVISDLLSTVLKSFDISLPQFNVLRILKGQRGNPANLSTVQERMIHKMSNTSRLIDKLVQKKLVQRIACKENRRKIEITITPSGLELLDKISPEITRVEFEIIKNIPQKKLETFNTILEQLRTF